MRMVITKVGLAAIFVATGTCAGAAASPTLPVKVMIVGTIHLANPAHDLFNVSVDDVLAPRRQAEIRRTVADLARFRPTKVAVEWPEDLVRQRYRRFLAGTLQPSRNEVVQFGFALARVAGSIPVYGIDADGDFPYDRMRAFAEAHGMRDLIDRQNSGPIELTRIFQSALNGSIPKLLRTINDPARIARSQDYYQYALQIGSGAEQPGPDLVASWYKRNFLICGQLLQLGAPGDRIVVFYGYGHAFLLRQCVRQTPGLQLVEPNSFLKG